jgi:hypothetical protein
MTAYLLDQRNGETVDSLDGLKSIALGVLGQAGYGQQQKWTIGNKHVSELVGDASRDEKNALFDAISLMIEYLVPCAMISAKTLQRSFMPKALRQLGKTKENFPFYSRQMLESERKLSSMAAEPRQNMAAMLVHLADGGAEKRAHGKPNVSSQYLTEEEINGNLFVFTAAGFDTTANAMSYALVLLAAYPEWQTWLQEELDTVFAGLPNETDADYSSTFPRLQRCLAIMVCCFIYVLSITLTLTSSKRYDCFRLFFIFLAVQHILSISALALHLS